MAIATHRSKCTTEGPLDSVRLGGNLVSQLLTPQVYLVHGYLSF
ncbi:hypothetical protein JMJ77_0009241 [Colletotrichum scovillei]|uniref:Uncharacterized protein n=1 Tax=Colletotrichum scovillei TaxID=1209932 RepID=A0A9P7QXD8_9PEZI|nr:hypothetical protein JMJ77_0009241 [Colletotrichum scovillei]KAG7052316.1 hypothetical protein JMJ78_0005336 [Colletotrichum scovillei]KAG7064608.1 hypothetical protein JMJ76_0012370 [Colletotrichum scovillei]